MTEESDKKETEGTIAPEATAQTESASEDAAAKSGEERARRPRAPRPQPPIVTPGSPLCPFLTQNLPGLGGALLCDPQNFIVDEIPAYLPCGEGEHYFVHIEKRGITHDAMISAMANAAGVAPRELGVAGRKDRHATTRQWISMPCAPVDPQDPAITLLECKKHNNKLRMGHLRGNHFDIHLSNLSLSGSAGEKALRNLEDILKNGFPNYFGHQRVNEHNVAQSLAFLHNSHRRVKDPKFLASIAQSAHFNLWLGQRVAEGTFNKCQAGDVLRKRDSGGLFVCEDPVTDQARMDRGEIDLSGPIFGEKSVMPCGATLEAEMKAFEILGISQRMLSSLKHFAPGSRRPARVVPTDLKLTLEGDTLHAQFTLPKGSYATVLLGELSHQSEYLRSISLAEEAE